MKYIVIYCFNEEESRTKNVIEWSDYGTIVNYLCNKSKNPIVVRDGNYESSRVRCNYIRTHGCLGGGYIGGYSLYFTKLFKAFSIENDVFYFDKFTELRPKIFYNNDVIFTDPYLDMHYKDIINIKIDGNTDLETICDDGALRCWDHDCIRKNIPLSQQFILSDRVQQKSYEDIQKEYDTLIFQYDTLDEFLENFSLKLEEEDEIILSVSNQNKNALNDIALYKEKLNYKNTSINVYIEEDNPVKTISKELLKEAKYISQIDDKSWDPKTYRVDTIKDIDKLNLPEVIIQNNHNSGMCWAIQSILKNKICIAYSMMRTDYPFTLHSGTNIESIISNRDYELHMKFIRNEKTVDLYFLMNDKDYVMPKDTLLKYVDYKPEGFVIANPKQLEVIKSIEWLIEPKIVGKFDWMTDEELKELDMAQYHKVLVNPKSKIEVTDKIGVVLTVEKGMISDYQEWQQKTDLVYIQYGYVQSLMKNTLNCLDELNTCNIIESNYAKELKAW